MNDIKLLNLTAGQPVSPDDTDIEINPSNGDFVWVSGHDRVRQNIVKILLTALTSNVVFSNYGTLLATAINQRGSANINQSIKDSIIQGIAYLQAIETSQLQSERIQALQKLTVTAVAGNKQAIVIKMEIVLEDGFVVVSDVSF